MAEYVKDQAVGMDRIEADFGRRLFMEFGERENIQVIFLAGAKVFGEKALGTAFSGCKDEGCLYWVSDHDRDPECCLNCLSA